MHRNNNGILGGVSWTPTLPTAPGPPISPFPIFSHNQRDQLLRNNRSASTMGTVFDFRPSFIGNSLATSNVISLPTNGMNVNYSNNFTDNLEHAVFSEEVQEEANSYFQQIYSHTGRLSVNDFIIKLKELRDSINLRDKELLMCVVKNLFDEYKFFQEYPDRELKTTAEVYGGLIREGIISNLQLATAVRRVIESIQAGTSRTLWDFGIVALNACRSVLHKYPKVCQMFMLSENFFYFPSILRECVTNGAQGLLPPSKTAYTDSLLYSNQSITKPPISNETNLNVVPVSVSSFKSISNTSGVSILNATNIDTLVKAGEREGCLISQPSSFVYEQVLFIFNNLSHANIITKSQELKKLLQSLNENFTQWLAQYLVMKRVTVEQNFQSLYNIFIMSINDKLLDDCIEKETYRNINILLRSDKSQAATNFGDRQLLKNLGHWLGLITIGRDKPILAKDLDLKALLLDAFNKGEQELLYVLPFVVKTLMATSKSTIFCSRSAWVYSIIKVLSEIHNEVDLKLNLKFEIEVLCKELNIDLASVEYETYLKKPTYTFSNESKLNDPGPFQELRIGNSVLTSAENKSPNNINCEKDETLIKKPIEEMSKITTNVSLTNQRHTLPTLSTPLFNYNNINIYNLEELLLQLKEPSNLYLFQYHPALKEICKAEILHAIKELIGNIIERSINSALTATEIICCKDFAFDPTDKNIRRCSYQMMRSLTAGMAAITCREPLVATMSDFLKHALYNNIGHPSSLNSNQLKIIDETVQSIIELNIEIATCFIIKSACEHGFIEIEKCLAKEFMTRREAAENNQVFAPVDNKTIPMCGKLPDVLRAKLGPISDSHIKIYDEFSLKICGFKPISSENVTKEIMIRNEVFLNNKNSTMSRFNFNELTTDEKINKIDLNLNEKYQIESNINKNKKLNQQNNILNTEEDTTRINSNYLFEQKSDIVFRDWLQMYYSVQHGSANLFSSFIELIQKHGIYINDESIFNFFKHCINLCLQITYKHLKNDRQQQIFARQKCYVTLDGFAKMICLILKWSDDSLTQNLKINLLRKVLSFLCNALYMDHEQRKFDFNGLSFQRILVTMFNELTNNEMEINDLMYSSIIEAFGNSLIILQPRCVPAFAFHWLDIIGHRVFIGRYLYTKSLNKEKFATIYTQLLLCALKFLAPFLCSFNLTKAILYYYKGTLCVLLVILHDFPEIFCEYHYAFCNVIPPNCIQLRNIILSAYPYDMLLPDPFTQSMKVIENLPEMAVNPKMHREVTNIISIDLRTRLDNYLTTRTPITFLSDLPRFLHKSDISGQKYNDIIINSLVIYIGIRAIESISERFEKISMKTIAHTSYMDIFQNLIVSFCIEGRYLLFNAIANQLRYPNTHTHYFSCVLLYLFLETNTEHVREQITRTLLERLIALRPHPWGLLTTFIELVSNPRYNFWSYGFVRCAPEIERLFLSVASSCHLEQNNNINQPIHLVDSNNNKS